MARTTGFLKGTVGAGDFDNRRDDVIARREGDSIHIEGTVKVLGQRKTRNGGIVNILGRPDFRWTDLPEQ